MAKFSATDFTITIDAEDVSESLAAVTLDISRESLEITAFGNTSRRYIAGLQDSSVTLSFHQDFAADSIDSIIAGALGDTVDITIQPVSGAISASNPSYEFSALVIQHVPFSSNVGDLATQDLTLPVDGDITRNVTPA